MCVGILVPCGVTTVKLEPPGSRATSSARQSASAPDGENVAIGTEASSSSRRPKTSSRFVNPLRVRSGVNSDAFAAKSADTHEQQNARERELVQTYRSHRKITKMHEHEARLEKLLEGRQDAPRATRKLRLPTSGHMCDSPPHGCVSCLERSPR
jgi:hypothetical protein